MQLASLFGSQKARKERVHLLLPLSCYHVLLPTVHKNRHGGADPVGQWSIAAKIVTMRIPPRGIYFSLCSMSTQIQTLPTLAHPKYLLHYKNCWRLPANRSREWPWYFCASPSFRNLRNTTRLSIPQFHANSSYPRYHSFLLYAQISIKRASIK